MGRLEVRVAPALFPRRRVKLPVMQKPLALMLAVLVFSAEAAAQSLAAALGEQLDSFPANTALYVKHLTTGEEVAIRAEQSFNSQSVIKIPIMVLAFQLAEQGKLNLDERVTLTRGDLRDGTGVFQYFDLGSSPTLRDLIQQMIVTSDNTATDLITVRVGGKEAVNAWLAKAGYQMRFLNRGWEYRGKLLAKLDPRLANLSAEEITGLQYAMNTGPAAPVFEHYQPLFTGPRAAWLDIVRNPENRRRHAANQRKFMVEDRDIWLGDITARETGRLLESIERCTVASTASCDTMKLFMRRQLAGSRRLPHFVDVPVAHKTGDSGNIANDVGIIYSRSGPIVIAALVTGITGSYGEAEDRIGRVAERVVAHFDGGASASSQPPPGITRTALIENDSVMMARLRMAPGAKEDMHTHPFSAIVVQLDPGEVDMRMGAARGTSRRPAGFVEFIAKETPHAAANVGAAALDLLTIALKPGRKPGGDAPAQPAPAGIVRTAVLDNSDARVARVEFAPAAREPVHSHPFDLVVVPLTAGRVEVRIGDRVETRDYATGEPIFLPRDVTHAVSNAGRTPLTVLSVGIK